MLKITFNCSTYVGLVQYSCIRVHLWNNSTYIRGDMEDFCFLKIRLFFVLTMQDFQPILNVLSGNLKKKLIRDNI